MAVPWGDLRALARAYGVQTAYDDVSGRRQTAARDDLLGVLRCLGAELSGPEEISAALRARQDEHWRQTLEPVTLAWEGRRASITLRGPEKRAAGRIELMLTLESGETRRWGASLADATLLDREAAAHAPRVALSLALPEKLPQGYHRLRVEGLGAPAETLLLAAPRRAFRSPDGGERRWGLFLPLYALHRREGWGAGDFTDLGRLLDWAQHQGADFVGTLPLLASFFHEDEVVGPYSPASRLFWNECYVDPARVPEFAACPAAQAWSASAATRREQAALRADRFVDYHRLMRLKRQVFELLAEQFFSAATPAARRAEYDAFLRACPEVEDYARFRAVDRQQGKVWSEWPEPLSSGTIPAGSYDPREARYHAYVQFLAQEQLAALAAQARAQGTGCYLDLPLGVGWPGYDVWRHRECFALRAAAGAPPDAFFTKGQNWGFPPLLPDALRRSGYRYFIDVVRRHLELASLLRVDHVMGLHRLFWIPHGCEARHGAYVQYPAEELYAVLALESHRRQATIIGENLGTAPKYISQALARHGIDGMYVLPFEIDPARRAPLRPAPTQVAASLNTHDLPTFAAFWQGLDIADRQDLGLLSEGEAAGEAQARARLRAALLDWFARQGFVPRGASESDLRQALLASLRALAESEARFVVVNLEDLWLEPEPQNVPGTWKERPNWRRKARLDLETLCADPEVLAALEVVRDGRRRNTNSDPR